MSSLFAQKDAKAVARGRMSGKARKDKGLNASALVKDKTTSEASTIPTGDIPVVHGNQLVLVNQQTGEKVNYHKPDTEAIQEMLGKTMSLDEFLDKTRNSSEALSSRVFNSDLTTTELAAVDLKANVKLFPEIVNSEGALRQRPLIDREREKTGGRFAKKQKLNDGNTRNVDPHPESLSTEKTIERLRSQKQWFKDIEFAAGRQAEAYEKAISDLQNSTERSQDEDESSTTLLPTSGLEVLLSEALPKPHSLTLDEWKKRETALLAHVHSIAERYRRELSGLTIYINRSLKTFEQLKMTLATLLCCLTEREIPAIDIEAWVLEINSGENTLRCRCQAPDEKSVQAKISGSDASPEVDLTSALESLWNEKEKSTLDIKKAREALEALGEGESHADQWDWAKPGASKDGNDNRAGTDYWIAKWDTWYQDHVKKIEEDFLNQQQELLHKRLHIEWEICNRKMEITNKTDEVRRLQAYMSDWQEKKMKHHHTEPRELYTPTTFPEIVELKAEELEDLHSKNAADKDLFWEQRHHEFLAANNLDKDTHIAATQSRLNRRIETLQAEVEVLNEEVLSDNLALNAKISDEEFIQLMAIDSNSREEWLTRREERIQTLTPEERLKISHQTSTSLRRSVEESSSVHWLTAEEYSKQQDMNVDSKLRSSQMMTLYENYESGSITFDFDSNKAWAELAELRHDEVNDDEEEQERMLLQEKFQQQLKELAQRRRSEKRASRTEV